MRPKAFEISIDQRSLDDLNERLVRTRWPARVPGEGWSMGSDRTTIERLAARWADGFDWRLTEARLNELPHYRAEVDGTQVHFLHLRAERANAPALVLTHGWPGSFLELEPIARRLSHPGDGGPAFDVVVPSLPGFAFSEQRPGLALPSATADLWRRLMVDVLGYERFGAHGGDLGAGVTSWLGAAHADRVVGIHLLAVGAPDLTSGPPLSADEQAHVARGERWAAEEGAYEHQQQTRPLTLAYGLSDSPVGLLAWIVEKLRAWSDCGGDLGTRFTDDDVLTWVSLYWLSGSIAPSFRPYHDHRRAGTARPRVERPTAVAVFPHDLEQPPREWIERSYALRRYTEMPRGGHFAAWEEPELLAADIRSFFADL